MDRGLLDEFLYRLYGMYLAVLTARMAASQRYQPGHGDSLFPDQPRPRPRNPYPWDDSLSRMGTDETASSNMGASTTKGPLPLGKVLSGWGRHTTASISGHARLGSSLRSEERRQSNRRKGEPRAAQTEPPRTSRRRSVLLPKERDEIALSAAKPSQ